MIKNTTFALLAPLGAALAAEFYVAPEGDDAQAGSKGKPFATLAQAQRAARALGPCGGATVYLRGGMYRLSEPLKLTAADSHTRWLACRGESPVLTGGAEVRGFVPFQGCVVRAEARACGALRPLRQLYAGGRRLELARYPNVDPRRPYESGWAFADSEPAQTDTPKRVLRVAPADLRAWSRPGDAEVSIFPEHEWWNNVSGVVSFDRSQRQITLKADCSYPITAGDRYFVRGPFEELDAPGEWYYDEASGQLYVWPPAGADPSKLEVSAPRLKTLVEFGAGATQVTVSGLTLECAGGTAVTMSGATNCLLSGCIIRQCGDYQGGGVSVSGGCGNGVVGCEISDIGNSGISLSGGDERTLTPAANYAEDNYVTRVGVIYKQGCGVTVGGVGNRVSRNTLCELPRFGVQFGGQRHLIERNHIHHVSLETMDTGAIYGGSLNWLSAHGTVIRDNWIHDVVGRSGKAGAWRSPYFAWGIYLDWTAMGVTVSNNVVARCPRAGIHLHDGRDNLVANNVFVDCGGGRHEHGATSQIELSGWDTTTGWWQREFANWLRQYDAVSNAPAWRAVASLRDPRGVPLPDGRTMHHNAVRHNVLCWSDPSAQAFSFRNVSFADNACDSNLLWCGGQPVKTGQLQAGAACGLPLALPNEGFEEGALGALPASWSWHIRPTAKDCATVADKGAHSGARCLRLEGCPDPANAGKEPWARIPSVKSAEVPLTPGRAYGLSVWLRAARPDTAVELGLQSYRAGLYRWQQVRAVRVGESWVRHELVFRFPKPGSGGHEQMTAAYVRLRLPSGGGCAWADDVELSEVALLDEWSSWQALGMDRHSVIADPLLAEATAGDCRLRAGSAAEAVGFRPFSAAQAGRACEPAHRRLRRWLPW